MYLKNIIPLPSSAPVKRIFSLATMTNMSKKLICQINFQTACLKKKVVLEANMNFGLSGKQRIWYSKSSVY